MSRGDNLGDRMKTYEAVSRMVLMPHSRTILRVDGRNFSNYLKSAEKPYDMSVIDDMKHVAVTLCQEISGAVIAYGQSDEISILISDLVPQAQPWFGGVVQKMVSVASGLATAALISRRGADNLPHFDARVFNLPNSTEAANYFIWRQRDAIRNSVSMAAQAKFSHKALHKKTGNEMQEMLFQEYGINWNDYPVECKQGWVIGRVYSEDNVSYTDKRTGEINIITAERSRWEPRPAERFSVATWNDTITHSCGNCERGQCSYHMHEAQSPPSV